MVNVNNYKSRVLTKDDWQFIKYIDKKFSEKSLTEMFNSFFLTEESKRVGTAYKKLTSTVREFCPQLKVPKYLWQSVYVHQKNMIKVINILGGDKHAKLLAWVHDLAEAITTDFTPLDDISKNEKYRLELIAANILFEGDKEKRALWDEYEERKSENSLITKDSDVLELLNCCNHIEYNHPKSHDSFNRIWDDVDNSLTSEVSLKALFDLEKDRKRIVKGKKPVSEIYKSIYGRPS